MKIINKILLGIVFIMVVSGGCSAKDPKLDSSSHSNLELSLEKMMSGLTPEEQEDFLKAMDIIARSEVDEYAKEHGSYDEGAIVNNMLEHIDGKTYNDIIDQANEIQLNPDSHNHHHH